MKDKPLVCADFVSNTTVTQGQHAHRGNSFILPGGIDIGVLIYIIDIWVTFLDVEYVKRVAGLGSRDNTQHKQSVVQWVPLQDLLENLLGVHHLENDVIGCSKEQ